MELGGLHHVTAVTSQASHNVAFYTQVLGLRLVKKTVNQDDVTAYHLFYADRLGHPGMDLTFFDWAFATRHRPGAGQVGRTGLRVHGWEALEWWRERFNRFGAPHGDIREEAGRLTLMFTDPEGQQLALVDDTVPPDVQVISPGEPWEKSPIPRAMAIRGLASARSTCVRCRRQGVF